MTDWDYGVEEEGSEDLYEDEQSYFGGPCTCKHSEDEHDYGSCGIGGCDCQAGWEY